MESPTTTHRPKPAPRAKAPAAGPAQMGNALEVMRVVSTVLVVLYHAALAYVATPLRLTLWVAFEPDGHPAFDVLVYAINGFVMPVFFLAAGVSAPAACESRGPSVFLKSRVDRLLRPLLFGALTILPLFYLLWGYGLMVTGRCDLDSILSWRFRPPVRDNLYGLGHLWFLEYLFLVSALWCGGWALARRGIAVAPKVVRLFDFPGFPVLFAVPTALLFLADSDTMLRVDNVIVPDVFRVLHYTLFFAAGGWVAQVGDPRSRFARLGPLYLTSALVVFGLMLPLLLRHAASPLGGPERVAYCLLAALFPWLTVFGALGTLLRADGKKGPVLRFLAETSFWVYLVHVPLVAFLQLALLSAPWPAPVKFLVVATLALGLSLASYGPIVRHSLIGLVINGARKRPPRNARFGPDFGWLAALALFGLVCAGAAWSSRTFLLGHNLYEIAPGRFSRSARLRPADLDALIRREGIKTVFAFTDGGEMHPWFVAQREVCRRRGVRFRGVPLRGGRAPSREAVLGLIELLDHSPAPVLFEGYRGTDEVGFASALALLLDGRSPAEAWRQYDLKYGQFTGPELTPLGRSLLAYPVWLEARRLPHTSANLREWAAVGRSPSSEGGPGEIAARRPGGPARFH